jgi:hypothetical protein
MKRLDLAAFITGPETGNRVERLNGAVADRAILPIVGPRGSGKDRFLTWWVQEGCASRDYTKDSTLKSDDIVLVNAQPGPVSSVPVGCVVFTRLWRALQEVERARGNGEPRRPLGYTKACTETHVVSVIDDNVAPLMDGLLPQALVVLNAQYLDSRTLGYLLELRSPVKRTGPHISMLSLILCASVEGVSSDDSQFGKLLGEGSRFGKLLSDFGEVKKPWEKRMIFPIMEGREFVAVMLRLIDQNLDAKIGDDVAKTQMYEEFANWTDCNWWLVRELAIVLDRALGPRRDNQRRIITAKVLEQVRQTWVERSGG